MGNGNRMVKPLICPHCGYRISDDFPSEANVLLERDILYPTEYYHECPECEQEFIIEIKKFYWDEHEDPDRNVEDYGHVYTDMDFTVGREYMFDA